MIEAEVADGGLAIYERDARSFGSEAALFHLVPADVANSLRFFVSRMQPADWEGESRSIAVTSALVGEGVTMVARSLASILANDLNRSVCLVETNWWNAPGDGVDAATLGRGAGLAGVLTGSCSVDDALMPTSDDRLVVLPSGELPVGRRPAAVASGGLHDVLESLAKDFETVVIDVPPVLKASEATVIAREAGGVVLVVRRGVTTEQQLRTAIEELDGTEVLGVIINRSFAGVPSFIRRFGLSV
jgi:Mrp family chromosome partitioning ATPase